SPGARPRPEGRLRWARQRARRRPSLRPPWSSALPPPGSGLADFGLLAPERGWYIGASLLLAKRAPGLNHQGEMTTEATEKRPHVGLFVTCLVDLFRPSVGFAAIKLLLDAGATVEVPESQTCCGQPAYNSGDRVDATAIARTVIETFERFDYLVAPSGSCAAMLRVHYPSLLADDPQ